MKSLYEALMARRADLCGEYAATADVERLGMYLKDASAEFLLRIYRELPVCRMETTFVVRSGRAYAPGPEFGVDYDAEQDHGFYWASPLDILEEVNDGALGAIAFQTGFVRIGLCVYGGDGYFLSREPGPPRATPLFRLYYDWISYPDRHDPPVPPQAIHLLHGSFESILAVANFEHGWMPDH